MYMMRDKKVPSRQHDIRWHRPRWHWQQLFDLYRQEGDTRPDDALTHHCKRVARLMNRFDCKMRYDDLQFATHEEPSGLHIRHVDAWADGTDHV